MNYFFTEKTLEEEIYEYCINNGIPLIYGGLLLSYRHQRGGEMIEDKKYYVYKMSGHYYTIDTKPVYEKVLFEGTDKECYEFVEKELENV